MTTYKLRISFTGISSNALHDLMELNDMAEGHDDYEGNGENLAYGIKSCISAYRDTLLALVRGDTDIEEVKDFWFHRTDPKTIKYDGTVVKFSEKGADDGI